MRKLLLTTAVVTVAASALTALGSSPAAAGPFCATYPEGGTRSCDYFSYAACAETISGAGGQCSVNPRYNGGYGGYEGSYAYTPGPVYGPQDGYNRRGYYPRHGAGMYVGY